MSSFKSTQYFATGRTSFGVVGLGGGGGGSSSNIGDLNAPVWAAAGPTGGTGSWGTIDDFDGSGLGDDESLTLGYVSSTGTAGHVRLECSGDTDSFQLVSVEGEHLDSPATFSALTNNHDYMYIAFQGTPSAGNNEIQVKIRPVMTVAVTKSMTINAYDHEGASVGTVVPTFTYSGRFETALTEAADITNSTDMVFGTGGVGGNLVGLKRTAPSATIFQTQCHSVLEVSDGGHAYIECTPTAMGQSPTDAHHWVVGFGYKDDYTMGTYGFDWMSWGFYCWGGGPIADRVGTTQELTNPSHPNDATLPWMDVNRSMRIEVVNDTVYLKYSDDDWQTESIFHTFSTPVDIPSNSTLVAGFSIHDPNDYGIIENIKLFGLLS